MGYLGRDTILGHNSLETAEVECPEWGGTILCRALSGRERGIVEGLFLHAQQTDFNHRSLADLGDVKTRTVLMAAIDEDGDRLFTNSDLDKLGALSAAPIDRIAAKVLGMSGVGDAEMEELESS